MQNIFKKREITLLLFIVVLVVLVSLRAPYFFRLSNLEDILNDTAILFMVAIAQFMVILIGGIDLSVASGIGFSGMSVALINQHYPNIGMFLIVLISLGVGFGLGSFNGILVSKANIPPIITTLGTMSIYRGFIYVMSGGTWVSADELTSSFRDFPHGRFLGISTLLWVAIITIVTFGLILNYTKTGREMYGLGGNELAARYVGINSDKIRYLVFTLGGIIVGMAGFLWVARYASAQNDTATGFELTTIAACVIGGVSITGGVGTIWGVVLGALFMGILNNALTQINISPFWQLAIQGFIILIAIISNTLVDRRNQRLLLKRRSL